MDEISFMSSFDSYYMYVATGCLTSMPILAILQSDFPEHTHFMFIAGRIFVAVRSFLPSRSRRHPDAQIFQVTQSIVDLKLGLRALARTTRVTPQRRIRDEDPSALPWLDDATCCDRDKLYLHSGSDPFPDPRTSRRRQSLNLWQTTYVALCSSSLVLTSF